MILQDWASKGVAGARNIARNLQAPATAPVVEPADVLSTGSTAKDWTVLVYMDGRNRLATSSLQALNKMEQIGSNDRVNVVVQSTIEPHWRELHKDGMQAIPTRRYYVQRDDRPDQITSPIVGLLDASVPLSEQSLADFIQWGMKNFPSERTMVVIKKHGAGFARIAGSEGEADRAPLSARETRNALEQVRQATGKSVDVVAFDSCSMQQMEVAYQLKDVAKVMTGSPEDIVASIYPYGTILDGLTRHPEMNERQLGRWVVEAHKIAVGRTIHSAADLSKLAQFGQAMRAFTASVVEQKVARDVLYTAMLNSKSMEAGDSDALQFNFRDLGGFLQQMAGDERVPQSVRDTAKEARQSLSDSVLKHYATSGRERLKRPTGYSTFLPWKALTPEVKASYAQLDYVKDSGWMELLDYTFSAGQPAAPAQPTTQSGLLTRLKRLPLKHYKKYISGYLPTACQYTPTCSQYAREAIETHGMLKGAWLGSLRVMSCNGHNSAGHDPVPGHVHGPECNHPGHLPAGTASRDFLTHPPALVEKSSLRRGLEQTAVTWAGRLGGMAWGAASALVAAPVGLALGAFFGYQAGTGKMDQFTAEMLQSHREATVFGMLRMARPLGTPGDAVHHWVSEKTGSAVLATAAGGVLGTSIGALAGAVGGAAVMAKEGNRYGRLWGRNLVKDMLGELPIHPENEAIVQRDYA